jgi:alkylresorcinol/alkylpyrone synthase
MPRIVAARTAFPPHYYQQEKLASALLQFADAGHSSLDPELVARLFRSVAVGGRHLALPIEAYATLESLERRNSEWMRVALEIGERAVRGALERAGLAPESVNLFVSASSTGIAVPSLEARVMNKLGFSTGCRRTPLFGLGCAAGAAGIARVSDHLRGYPEHAAILLCLELCSLTFQSGDASVANVIACGLFGDGAACVVLAGDEHPLATRAGPRVVATESALFPNTERMMGWDVG